MIAPFRMGWSKIRCDCYLASKPHRHGRCDLRCIFSESWNGSSQIIIIWVLNWYFISSFVGTVQLKQISTLTLGIKLGIEPSFADLSALFSQEETKCPYKFISRPFETGPEMLAIHRASLLFFVHVDQSMHRFKGKRDSFPHGLPCKITDMAGWNRLKAPNFAHQPWKINNFPIFS